MPKKKSKTPRLKLSPSRRSVVKQALVKITRPIKPFRDGVLTSGSTYYMRVTTSCFVKKFSQDELLQLQTPGSFLRARLAVILKQKKQGVDIHHLVVTREALATNTKRFGVLEYGS